MNNEGCDSRRLSLPLDARVPRLRRVSRQGDRPPKRFRRGVDGKLLAVYNGSCNPTEEEHTRRLEAFSGDRGESRAPSRKFLTWAAARFDIAEKDTFSRIKPPGP